MAAKTKSATNPPPKPRRKSWAEKFAKPAAAKVERIEKDFGDMKQGDRMLVATPRLVDAYVRGLGPGQTVALRRLRADLAAQNDADTTCPLTAGIFLRIVSENAWEQHERGAALEEITPFWRAVDPAAPLAKKLACGAEFVRRQRAKEAMK